MGGRRSTLRQHRDAIVCLALLLAVALPLALRNPGPSLSTGEICLGYEIMGSPRFILPPECLVPWGGRLR